MKVLIGYDGSLSSEAALEDLRRAGLPREGESLVVTVGEVLAAPDLSVGEAVGAALTSRRVASAVAKAQAARVLEEARGMAAAASRAHAMAEWAVGELGAIGLDTSCSIQKGDPRSVLVDEARRWDADCIFVGPRRFGGTLERLRLGSVSSAVGNNAHCSVEVVRSPGDAQ